MKSKLSLTNLEDRCTPAVWHGGLIANVGVIVPELPGGPTTPIVTPVPPPPAPPAPGPM